MMVKRRTSKQKMRTGAVKYKLEPVAKAGGQETQIPVFEKDQQVALRVLVVDRRIARSVLRRERQMLRVDRHILRANRQMDRRSTTNG